MARVGLAGDWHGNGRWAVSVLEWYASCGITEVYQVGDFGIWPGNSGRSYLEMVVGACRRGAMRLWIVPGNHEDWDQIEDVAGEKQILASGSSRAGEFEVALLPRGYTWEVEGRSFVAFGGAPSIDFEHRTEGKSWWPAEMPTMEHAKRLEGVVADVMLCHDAPDGGTKRVQEIINTPPHLSMWSEAGLRYAREGRMVMNAAYALVDPKLYVHGHFHAADYRSDEETGKQWLSLGMDGEQSNAVVLDTDTLSVLSYRDIELEKIEKIEEAEALDAREL